MSVLASKRCESKAQFVTVAYEIYDETIRFLTRVSARYARLVAQPIAELAGSLMDNCESANSIYPQGRHLAIKKQERTKIQNLTQPKLQTITMRIIRMGWRPDSVNP